MLIVLYSMDQRYLESEELPSLHSYLPQTISQMLTGVQNAKATPEISGFFIFCHLKRAHAAEGRKKKLARKQIYALDKSRNKSTFAKEVWC